MHFKSVPDLKCTRFSIAIKIAKLTKASLLGRQTNLYDGTLHSKHLCIRLNCAFKGTLAAPFVKLLITAFLERMNATSVSFLIINVYYII